MGPLLGMKGEERRETRQGGEGRGKGGSREESGRRSGGGAK